MIFTRMQLKHLLVLDFEATCCDDNTFTRTDMEIIEFPICVVDLKTKRVIDEYHSYVKPKVHPTLTNFCTTLTGIQQTTVDNAKDISTVLSEVKDFIKKYPDSVFVTCGDWDLKTMLPTQTQKENLQVSSRFSNWLNIKKEFAKCYGKKAHGMVDMLNELKLPLVGHHHSGIDDTRNIARMATQKHKFEYDGKKLSRD